MAFGGKIKKQVQVKLEKVCWKVIKCLKYVYELNLATDMVSETALQTKHPHPYTAQNLTHVGESRTTGLGIGLR